MTERKWVPHPDSWEDVAIDDAPEPPPPQLDLFAESPCNQSARETQSKQRLQ
jgi:hypothetical protein